MTENLDPILKFNNWWQQALENSPLKQKSAVCISTVDDLGFPQARFVDLKLADESGFVFCTYLDSPKGKQLADNNKIAMTAWWDHMGFQVRVVGTCEPLAESKAQLYWQKRSRSAQLTTQCFEQSALMASPEILQSRLEAQTQHFTDTDIAKPDNWGGFVIVPHSIEFLTFAESRLHLRECYNKHNDGWQMGYLQP